MSLRQEQLTFLPLNQVPHIDYPANYGKKVKYHPDI
jgi:hypothetical protein